MKLQQLIRRYKNQTHQTNEQLAKQFHVSENTVSRWLRGEVTSLQEETAHNVSAVLGFDVSAMLNGSGYNQAADVALGTAAQTAGVQAAISVSYIWVETVCYIIGAAILILFWTVEKDLPREQAEIAKRNKK